MRREREFRPNSRLRDFSRKFGRGVFYAVGFISWGICVGGVGRLAAFIIHEIRESDRRQTAIVYDPATRSLRVALLLSEPLEGVNSSALAQWSPPIATDAL